MEMSVSEYAEQEQLSARRVRQLAADGKLPARRVGRVWIIDGQQGSSRDSAPARPMSLENAWSFARGLSGEDNHTLRRDRYRRMIVRLQTNDSPERLLAAWLAKRADHHSYNAQPEDLDDLRNDPRLWTSGVSHEAAGLLTGREVEGYVSRDQEVHLADEFLLTETPLGKGNVLLHVADGLNDIPLVFVVADLAERGGLRERQAAHNLLVEMLRNA